MFGKYDITFCGNERCPHDKCIRHHSKVPFNVPVSIAAFAPRPDGKCDWRFDDIWDTVEEKDLRPVEIKR